MAHGTCTACGRTTKKGAETCYLCRKSMFNMTPEGREINRVNARRWRERQGTYWTTPSRQLEDFDKVVTGFKAMEYALRGEF